MREKRDEGLVFHGTARVILLISSLKKTHQEFSEKQSLMSFMKRIFPSFIHFYQSTCEKVGQDE